MEEEEHTYGITFGYTPDIFNDMLSKIKVFLPIKNLKQECQKRRIKMLADTIDVTGFLVWFVENYP